MKQYVHYTSRAGGTKAQRPVSARRENATYGDDGNDDAFLDDVPEQYRDDFNKLRETMSGIKTRIRPLVAGEPDDNGEEDVGAIRGPRDDTWESYREGWRGMARDTDGYRPLSSHIRGHRSRREADTFEERPWTAPAAEGKHRGDDSHNESTASNDNRRRNERQHDAPTAAGQEHLPPGAVESQKGKQWLSLLRSELKRIDRPAYELDDPIDRIEERRATREYPNSSRSKRTVGDSSHADPLDAPLHVPTPTEEKYLTATAAPHATGHASATTARDAEADAAVGGDQLYMDVKLEETTQLRLQVQQQRTEYEDRIAALKQSHREELLALRKKHLEEQEKTMWEYGRNLTSKLDTERTLWENEKDRLRIEIERLTKDLSDISHTAACKDQELREAMTELADYRAKYNQCKIQLDGETQEKSQVEGDLQTVRRALHELRDKEIDYSETLLSTKARAEFLEKALREKNEELVQLREVADRTREETVKYGEQVEGARLEMVAHVEELQAEFQNSIQRAARKISKRDTKIRDLRQQVAETETRCTDMQKEAEAIVRDAQERVKSAQAHFKDKLDSVLAQLHKAEQEKEHALDELRRRQKELDNRHEDELAHSESKINSLLQDLNGANTDIHNLKCAKMQLETSMHGIESEQTHLRAMIERLETDAERNAAFAKEDKETIAVLRQRLVTAEDTIASLKEELGRRDSEAAKLAAVLDTGDEVKHWKAMAQHERALRSQKESELRELKQQLTSAVSHRQSSGATSKAPHGKVSNSAPSAAAAKKKATGATGAKATVDIPLPKSSTATKSTPHHQQGSKSSPPGNGNANVHQPLARTSPRQHAYIHPGTHRPHAAPTTAAMAASGSFDADDDSADDEYYGEGALLYLHEKEKQLDLVSRLRDTSSTFHAAKQMIRDMQIPAAAGRGPAHTEHDEYDEDYEEEEEEQ